MRELKNVSRENSRVVAFSIAPLDDFCKNFNRALFELDQGELDKVAEIFDDFTQMEQKLNKLKTTKFAQEYHNYQKMLSDICKSRFFLA